MSPERIISFCKNWGQAHLTAIPLDGVGRIRTKSCRSARDIATFLQENADRNLYFTVNPCSPVDKKITKQDIRRVDWLHVDIDARRDRDLGKELARIRRLVNSRPNGIPPPHIIIFSGGGYQLFWRLESPLTIAAGERLCQEVGKLYGGDACWNCDRIMRLPHTTNRPDERKRARGRVDAETDLSRAEWGARAKFSALRIPTFSEVLRTGAMEETGTSPSRSEHLFSWIKKAKRANIPDEDLSLVLMDASVPVAASVVDKPNPSRYLERQLERAGEAAAAFLMSVEDVNKRFALIKEHGGKALVMGDLDRPDRPPTMQRLSEFMVGMRNRWVTDKRTLGQEWVESPERREYDAVVFDPSERSGGVEVDGRVLYNTWGGWAVEPQEGDGHLPFKDHIAENVCGGDLSLFGYIWGWMARCVQHPATPAETAIVMQGAQGVGKTFVGEQFGRLFGRHKLIVSQSHHLTGNFNSHLRDIVLLVAEEAFFAGDKRHEGILKTLITGETLAIEGKGVDVINSPNRLHIIITSNEDWIVPVGAGDRRFVVTKVGSARRRDKRYFGWIADALDNGGRANLLHELLTKDLSSYNPLDIPETTARRQQAERTLEPDRRWWADVLRSGKLYRDFQGGGGRDWGDGEPPDLRRLYSDYVRVCSDARIPRLLMFGDWLARWARNHPLDSNGNMLPREQAEQNFWTREARGE